MPTQCPGAPPTGREHDPCSGGDAGLGQGLCHRVPTIRFFPLVEWGNGMRFKIGGRGTQLAPAAWGGGLLGCASNGPALTWKVGEWRRS